MASDRVIVNAGGRRFETTTTTLLSSGSAYFSALLGFTGSALGSLPRNSNETHSSIAITSHQNGRKRVRNDGGADEDQDATERHAAVKEIFIDREPDLFENVLFFMRSARLPSKCRKDMDRLEDLKAEALFFGFQELERACDAALNEIRASIDRALKPEPVPKARCCSFCVEAGEMTSIEVPKGEVLYIVSATLAGRVRSHRYALSEKEEEEAKSAETERERDDARHGCYLGPCDQRDDGDYKLALFNPQTERNGSNLISIAHVCLDHYHLDARLGMNLDLRQDLRICIAPSDEEGDQELTFWHTVDQVTGTCCAGLGSPRRFHNLAAA